MAPDTPTPTARWRASPWGVRRGARRVRLALGETTTTSRWTDLFTDRSGEFPEVYTYIETFIVVEALAALALGAEIGYQRAARTYAARVQLLMDDQDFARLCTIYAAWAKSADKWLGYLEVGRFEFEGDRPSMKWRSVYWLGERYAAVIPAKSFLADRGYGFEVIRELSSDEYSGWVILTDYALPLA
jgi:hypothetical protein